jgi:hypothetical protein
VIKYKYLELFLILIKGRRLCLGLRPQQYPLLSQKSVDFNILLKKKLQKNLQFFKQIVNLVADKAHLSEEGLNSIISLKSILNSGLSDKLKSIFPNVKSLIRPVHNFDGILNPYWISGFVSAEGCFTTSYSKDRYFRTSKSQRILGFALLWKIFFNST